MIDSYVLLTLDIGAAVVGLAALVIAILAYRRTNSLPNVKFYPDNRPVISIERLPDQQREIIRFYLSVVLTNEGAMTTAIFDIQPRIIHPDLKLDNEGEQRNNSYWYILPAVARCSPIRATILQGYMSFPINIEMRFYFNKEEDVAKALGGNRGVELALDYVWSSHKKEGLISESKKFQFGLGE